VGVRVETGDPFDLPRTTETLCRLLKDRDGVRVLILRQPCTLLLKNGHPRRANVRVDRERCVGAACGCNRLCTRVFRCPGLSADRRDGKASVDEAVCTSCGVCVQVCPVSAILKEDV
jgi:indolepyruvate ferredoxin oxidoreductase alpha subunit